MAPKSGPLSTIEAAADPLFLADEAEVVTRLLETMQTMPHDRAEVHAEAVALVERVRSRQRDVGAMEAFMRQYDLSSEEGVILMCLAEALLRIPDNHTAERLIADKLAGADWQSHLGQSESVFVNASTWGLMLTGRVVRLKQVVRDDLSATLGRLVARSGEPVIRLAIRQAMKIMGHQYVMGRTIDAALERANKKENRRFRYSFDMLGEAALTAPDAKRYRQAYQAAIERLATHQQTHPVQSIEDAPSISVKLSALHPRYHPDQRDRVLAELIPVVSDLAKLARRHDVALTIDAEESDRLTLSLEIFEAVLADSSLAGWDGLGLALQAYQKRAVAVIDRLAKAAELTGHRIPVRLVKGAYWDTEIKQAQVDGLAGYPVFTRKASTDLSYLVCAQKLLSRPDAFFPQFATHNAHTIASIKAMAPEGTPYEYQRLHGMGVELYDEVLADKRYVSACRVYAPVGEHEDLLPYLVRRLLENGANTSFVNRIVDENIPTSDVVTDPVEELERLPAYPHPKIPLPSQLYGPDRLNARGTHLGDEQVSRALERFLADQTERVWTAGYQGSVGGADQAFKRLTVRNPANTQDVVGEVVMPDPSLVQEVIAAASQAQPRWAREGFEARAACLNRMADLLEETQDELIALCAREAGKTLRDGVAEVREAVDFCRYYAMRAMVMAQPETLPGPTGERNVLMYRPRGVFVCISPWNFPLAIFTGQVAAALVTGNAVIAKPAEQTTLMGIRAVELFHQAGVPTDVLHAIPGGADIGRALTSHPSVAGVAFTGSTETARVIARTLLDREAPLATLIAETGGQNAMIVDSSALPEQVIKDVISSAFLSAGQRCSALRVLCLQTDIADHMVAMLKGAMQELTIGSPQSLSTDIGPIIDSDQQGMLKAYVEQLESSAQPIGAVPLPSELSPGHWFAPVAYEIQAIEELKREIFGPVLHVVRYRADALDDLIDQINGTGYGLTLGVHSRIDQVQIHVAERVHVGNCYINRNMTGAVVGVQPFGGEGLSGTGPKAGGPNYLQRFCTERVLTTNTAAVGGNASLLALTDD